MIGLPCGEETRAAVGMGIPMGYGCGMGMGTMMNPHGSVGIPWGFSNGFRITWKRVEYSAFFVI